VLANKAYWQYRLTPCYLARFKREKFGLNVEDTAELRPCRGAHTKRKFKYGKELSPRGLECECTQEERSTSITKQLVFQYPFWVVAWRAG
jgi:hypothetical protein